MPEKKKELLDKQITKLSEKDFDLDAWKTSAIHLLGLIFGDKDPKAKAIEDLKIDYGSWALRDSGADYKPIESCKKKGREILEIAKDEIDLLGTMPVSAMDIKIQELLSTEQLKKHTGSQPGFDREGALKQLTKSQLIKLLLEIS